MIHQSEIATYKGLIFEVVVDGAGLDMIATDEASLADIKQMEGSISHELFCKVFDFGYSKGLKLALEHAGASIA
jgi:hypothetical protein